jgi:hypothetical protein
MRARRHAGACLAVLSAVTLARAGELLVDPTRPSSVAAAPGGGGELQVQAILTRSGVRVAIVNGRPVQAGDHIADVLIEEVSPEGVRYAHNGHSAFARLSVSKVAVRRAPASGKDVP